MSRFFPVPRILDEYSGVTSHVYDIDDAFGTQIIVSRLDPGAVVPPHQHKAVQFGMVLDGNMELAVGSRERRLLEALKEGYVLPPYVTHSAFNSSGRCITTMDFKTTLQDEDRSTLGDFFLTPTPRQEIKTGISFQFFVTPWFEVMVSRIPKGGTMPKHRHVNVQFGVGIDGEYQMLVGDEERSFTSGCVYYAPEDELHSGFNPNDDVATSLNIFMPPRYNKAQKPRPYRASAPQEC